MHFFLFSFILLLLSNPLVVFSLAIKHIQGNTSLSNFINGPPSVKDFAGKCGPDNSYSRCPFNLCCSKGGWCGTTTDHCKHDNCIDGYGHCGPLAPPPSCKQSNLKRNVAYYQSEGGSRVCDIVPIEHIKTAGLTHINFAFGSIHPKDFKFTAARDEDWNLYKKFTALRSDKLQTWIAVGGGDFSLKDKPTFKTWSEMASSLGNRHVFIQSLKEFMIQYKFQGVDLDWEFPTSLRGGRNEDFFDLVHLVKEMRQLFGSQFGISVAVPSDINDLSGFDLAGLQPFVDFFNFMSYDLSNGKVIKPQSDLRDIEKCSQPFWFAGLDMAKFNLGIPHYGRGFEINEDCNGGIGCQSQGPSIAGPCTKTPGVLSNIEIFRLVRDRHMRPSFNRDAMVKEITYDGYWMAFDDLETTFMKADWAKEKCFGGLMHWSIDFDNGY